jgi:formate/nitrite transporter
MNREIRIDAFIPAEIATRAERIGVQKANMDTMTTFSLAVLAGAFIAMGAVFATTTLTGAQGMMPYGAAKLLGGLVFCLGLVLVVVAGAELFTGNNLIVMAWASGKISTGRVLRNWAIVYVGNFLGAIFTAALMFATRQYTFNSGGIGATALSIAVGKVQLTFVQAVALGVMCNALVCLAVWLTLSARSTLDKIAAIIFPVTAFVAAGFEHSIANMYFVPIGLFIRQFDPAFAASTGIDLNTLTWGNFLLHNLLPVTIGNIFGGAVLVATVYWFIFLRAQPDKALELD